MTTLGWVLTALAIICLGSVVTVAVIGRMLYKRMRQSRALTSTVLRARSGLSWGPRRELLKLRLRLNDALAGGQAAVTLAAHSDAPRGDLPRLFRRIQSEGVALETQLRLMATETDPAALAQGIPMARRRVDQVDGLVRGLRTVVADGLGEGSDNALTQLRNDVDREVTALNAGLQELRTLNRGDAVFDQRHQPAMDRLSRGNKS